MGQLTKKAVELETRFCKHADGTYSLALELSNCQVSLSTHSYDHIIGYRANFGIFDLSVEDMLNLANKIQEQVFIIKRVEADAKALVDKTN
jgi:hypothetical protein